MTIKEALSWSKRLLEEKGVENPKASAEFLLRQILGVNKAYLIANDMKGLNPFSERKFKNWVKRRAKHEPVWYITGKIEFYGQDLFVNKNVLIPRPETELMIERIISEFSIFNFQFSNKSKKDNKTIKILDIGTGSGAIILTLANQLSNLSSLAANQGSPSFFASDISKKALSVAIKNAKNLGLGVTFKQGDLFGPWVGQKFDLIVANLPYIPHEDMATLAFDIMHYEPRTALDGGIRGLEIYKRFFEELPGFVNPNAKVYCEIGHDQGDEVYKLAKKLLPKAKIEVTPDYAGQDRLVIIELK